MKSFFALALPGGVFIRLGMLSVSNISSHIGAVREYCITRVVSRIKQPKKPILVVLTDMKSTLTSDC